MCPTVTMLILVTPCGYLAGVTPLLVLVEVSKFGTLLVGVDAALKADLVFIGEKLGIGAFTFYFTGAGREHKGSGTGIEAGTAGMGSLWVMS